MSTKIIRSSDISFNQPISIDTPLDICPFCSKNDGLPTPCPLLSVCAETRKNTLLEAQRRIDLRRRPAASPGFQMGIAMASNDISDMLSDRTAEQLGNRGGQDGTTS